MKFYFDLQTWMYVRMYENLFLIDFFSMWYEWTHDHISLIFFKKAICNAYEKKNEIEVFYSISKNHFLEKKYVILENV